MNQHATAQAEIIRALTEHFDRSRDPLDVDQIGDMTALSRPVLESALSVLARTGHIEGVIVAEYGYPVKVTGIRYD